MQFHEHEGDFGVDGGGFARFGNVQFALAPFVPFINLAGLSCCHGNDCVKDDMFPPNGTILDCEENACTFTVVADAYVAIDLDLDDSIRVGSSLDDRYDVGPSLDDHCGVGSSLDDHCCVGSSLDDHYDVGPSLVGHYNVGLSLDDQYDVGLSLDDHDDVGLSLHDHYDVGLSLHENKVLDNSLAWTTQTLQNLTDYLGGRTSIVSSKHYAEDQTQILNALFIKTDRPSLAQRKEAAFAARITVAAVSTWFNIERKRLLGHKRKIYGKSTRRHPKPCV